MQEGLFSLTVFSDYNFVYFTFKWQQIYGIPW